MCADIHDGREQSAPFKGPNTDARDQLSPDRHIWLAPHGRSIQTGASAKAMTTGAEGQGDRAARTGGATPPTGADLAAVLPSSRPTPGPQAPAFKDWRPYLQIGERATVAIIAADRKQARVCLRYVKGLLSAAPMLRALITSETRESVNLDNRVTIEVHTASMKTTRGYAICAALLDELAFLPTDEGSAEPDREILTAIRPGMASVPGSMLLCASSPYARRGELWNAFNRYFGKDDAPVLVWQASTRTMNPKIPQSVVDAAMQRDPAAASAEYGAIFRSDLEAFVSREAVQACSTDIVERPPEPGITYFGFVDPAGGSGGDDMALAIAHYDFTRQTVILDALRWFKPAFSPEVVTREFSTTLKRYNINTIVGARYGGEYPREQFSKFHIKYEPSAKSKSDLYVDLLPLINSARIQLLNQPKMLGQLLALERKTARSGRDTIDHPEGPHHDDLINCVAGVASLATAKQIDVSLSWVDGNSATESDREEEARRWRVASLMQHIMYSR